MILSFKKFLHLVSSLEIFLKILQIYLYIVMNFDFTANGILVEGHSVGRRQIILWNALVIFSLSFIVLVTGQE